MNKFIYNTAGGFTEKDLDDLIRQMQNVRHQPVQATYVGEFGMLIHSLALIHPAPIHWVSHWYLPKRTKKILAEGRIGRKESNLRVVVYRNAWTSSNGIVKFIGPSPENALVSHAAKRFCYELYNGTTLLLQTNDLQALLNFPL